MEASIDKMTKERAFTIKAIVAGLIGILLIAGGSKFSPTLAKQTLLGHQLGIGIYFYFFLICLIWNPFWTKFFPKMALNIKELAVAMVMTLTAGGFAWYGWMKQFVTQNILIMGNGGFGSAGWKTYGIKRYVETDLLPNSGEYSEEVVGNFVSGISPEKEWVNFEQIPWEAWVKPVIFWGSLIVIVALMCLALLLLIHRQWIRNEKLTYPLATVAETLFKKEDPKSCFADIFRSKMFWMALIAVVVIHGWNYAVASAPTSGFKPIPMSYPLGGLSTTFPIIAKAGCGGIFGAVKICFLIIGISYFLAPALSLSVGLNGFVYLLFAAEIYEATGQAPIGQELEVFRAGAYLAFAVLLFILGRRYYGSIMWKAISWSKVEDEDKAGVLGARLFILTALLTVLMLTFMGMDLILACGTTLMIIIVYLVFTRIVCEAGIPMLVSPFMPTTFFSKLFGGVAIGPENLLSSGQTSGVFFGDMKQLMMPYVATGMKLADDAGIRIRRIGAIVTISILVAFGVALTMHLWQYYSMGITDGATKTSDWQMGVNVAVSEVGRLHRNEQLKDRAGNPPPSQEAIASGEQIARDGNILSRWASSLKCQGLAERLASIEPEKINFVFYFIGGIIAVFFTGFMRTRFLWWPFHAVIFCIWNTQTANWIWFSFLFGWMIRSLIIRLGGEKNYVKLKPIFLGLIFGDVVASGLILLNGLIYYLLNGKTIEFMYQV